VVLKASATDSLITIHKELYNEIACFDPNRFKEVKTHPEMINITTIAEALLKLSRHGLQTVSSIYIWSKNFSHSVNEKSEAKMAAIDVQ
jgi:hypothetical protein